MLDWKVTIAIVIAMLVWVVGLQLVKKVPNAPTRRIYQLQQFGMG